MKKSKSEPSEKPEATGKSYKFKSGFSFIVPDTGDTPNDPEKFADEVASLISRIQDRDMERALRNDPNLSPGQRDKILRDSARRFLNNLQLHGKNLKTQKEIYLHPDFIKRVQAMIGLPKMPEQGKEAADAGSAGKTPKDWKCPGLPENLKKFYEALPTNGTKITTTNLELSDLSVKGRHPAHIMADHRWGRWQKWIEKFIGHERGYYWRKA